MPLSSKGGTVTGLHERRPMRRLHQYDHLDVPETSLPWSTNEAETLRRRQAKQFRANVESNLTKREVSALGLHAHAERQTFPDERWSVGFNNWDGWHLHRGWALAHQRGKRHYVGAWLQFGLSLGVKPVYKVVYAPGFVQSWARLTGEHPIRVARKMVERGMELVR